MKNLNDAILSAYEDYADALDYVKGWKVEANRRKGVVMSLINVSRKAEPELSGLSAKDIFARTAEMYEAGAMKKDATDEVEAEAQPTEDPQDLTTPAADENPEPNA